ncbi:endonuclease/exonuclease/phosphatase family protein [Pseudomonas sp. B1(2018)]|uniref:endonuclease/exonuclease/phosphatase family protein n=1 Tax=Pseudomonas sp. B1(2018) TaxID=2233856 RepID=UPI001057D0E2|nr:endonuclease/exonuclease/phosphatase family protein [Pseudomonas sp. B1(2018)]
MQLKCLFWNTGRKAPDLEISELVASSGANFIALAEYINDGTSLLHELSSKGLDFLLIPQIGCDRITLMVSSHYSFISHKREADRYTIKELAIPGFNPVLLAFVHLPSKMHASDLDQVHIASFFKQDLEKAELEAGHTNTIVTGDFNMNPFDDGMMSAVALNSLPCLVTANKKERVLHGNTHSFFYNPTWNLLGDFTGVPGTYFHSSPTSLSHYWNTLDQVILRPSVASQLDKTSLKILTTAGPIDLVGKKNRPKISDHLPIFFAFNLA